MPTFHIECEGTTKPRLVGLSYYRDLSLTLTVRLDNNSSQCLNYLCVFVAGWNVLG